MKKLFALMILLPVLSFAQDVEQNKPYTPKNEIGVSTGIAPSFLNKYGNLHTGTEIWLTTRLTYLHNLRNTQLGIIVEGGAYEFDDGSIVAAAVLNRKFPIGKSYLYAGGTAGFYYANNISEFGWVDRNELGYTLGVQAGFSLHLSNRFSFISEVGLRSTQIWFENYHRVERTNWRGVDEVEWYRFMDNRFTISVPATMGIRYRF